MGPTNSNGDVQSRVRRFVTYLAEKGGCEQYWIRLHGESFNRTEKETVIKHCMPLGNEHVALDAGCGEGRLTFALAEMYGHVYAIDFSEQSCECLKRKAQDSGVENITTRYQDIANQINLPLVDTIVLVQVLQHFDNASDRMRALRNLRECLKIGGRILITVFNYDRIVNKLRRMKRDVYETSEYPYYHYFSIQELEDLLSTSGFGNIRMRGCINLPAFIHESVLGKLLWKWDVRLSSFAASRYLGIYLLATAERTAP